MQYCLIENNAITDGPKPLPRSWRNISGLHLLSQDRLADHGWLPYMDDGPPEYDPNTQAYSKENVISKGAVTATYTVSDLTADQAVENLSNARSQKKAELTAYAKSYLSKAMADYSEWEAIVWPLLIAEAEKFMVDETVGEYMAAEIGGKYKTAADLATVLLARKEAMKQLRAGVVLARQQKEAEINAAETLEELVAINIEQGWS